jgi:hypothetical protein
MSSTPRRKVALIAGAFWIITFLASIPALLLYAPLLNHAHYVLGAGADTRIAVGALLEVILVIAGIGTAVTMSTPTPSMISAAACHSSNGSWQYPTTSC